MKEVEFSKKLTRYLSSLPPNDKFGFLNCVSNSITVSDVQKINKRAVGNQVYSFLLECNDGKVEKRSAYVLKTYNRSLDPILRRYNINENIDRCVKEFQVLNSLKRVGFPVPNTRLYELEVNVFSLPFIVMEREDLSNNRLNDLNEFAKNLVWLHSLDVKTLGISVLKTPEDEYEFARKCLRYLKLYLNLYPSRNKELMKEFRLVINWLESNIHMCLCPKYSLLHGDYRANFNTVMTKSLKMVVIDWEDSEIGDPAYDVAMTYTRMRADDGEKTANHFVQKYMEGFDGNLAERLFFYKMVSHLRLAISHSSVFSNPIRTYQIYGIEGFISFPLLNLPVISNRIGTNSDLIWIKNFQGFFKENRRIFR